MLRKEAGSLRLGVYGMRWMGCAVCGMALLGAGLRLEAQQAPAGKSPIMVTTGSPSAAAKAAIASKAAPEKTSTAAKQGPLLPDGFAGWTATEKPKTVTDPAELDSAHVAALKEYSCTGGMVGELQRVRARR